MPKENPSFRFFSSSFCLFREGWRARVWVLEMQCGVFAYRGSSLSICICYVGHFEMYDSSSFLKMRSRTWRLQKSVAVNLREINKNFLFPGLEMRAAVRYHIKPSRGTLPRRMTFRLPPRSFSLDFPLAGASEAVCPSPHRERVLTGSSRRPNPLPWPPWREELQLWPRLLSQQTGERALHLGAGQAAARQVPEASGVFICLAFWAPWMGRVDWWKGCKSSMQKLNGLRRHWGLFAGRRYLWSGKPGDVQH